MRILVIADPILTVPPRGYGGAERVIAVLCKTLRQKGHHVTLLAARGSEDYGRLITHVAPDNRSYPSRAKRKLLFQPVSLAAALGADVVHNFGRVDYLWSLLRTRKPLIHSFGNPITAQEVDLLLGRSTRLVLVSVSNHQRERFSDGGRWETVYNAIDTERLRFSPKADDPPYLAFLGRLTQNKGVHVAIEVARRAGLPLKIAGNISNESGGREYFATQVEPQLGRGIEWVGELNDDQKVPFLGGARALLFPILWDEPFGMVQAEALSCGTPVIGFRRASTPEVIHDGETGFLCDSSDEMVTAVGRIAELQRPACRFAAESNFSAEIMTERFLSIYRRVVAES